MIPARKLDFAKPVTGMGASGYQGYRWRQVMLGVLNPRYLLDPRIPSIQRK